MPDSSVKSTAEDARGAAVEVADDAKAKAGAVTETAKNEVRSVVSDAKTQASDVLGTARSELRTQAEGQAKTLSATLSDFSRQLGDMADGNADSDTQVVQLARTAADQLAQRAQRVDQDGIDGVVSDVKRFARNRPGAFVFASVVAGFAIGRLAKHSDLGAIAQHAKEEIDTDQLKPASSDTTSGDSNHSDEDSARTGGAGLPEPTGMQVRP